MTLEDIKGTLVAAVNRATRGTILCSDQLMKERRTNSSLMDHNYHTGDGIVYSVDNYRPTLRITREAVNPVFKNIHCAPGHLMHDGIYPLSYDDFKAVKADPETVTVDLTKWRLHGGEGKFRYIFVGNCVYNPEEEKLVHRLFGPSEEEFHANLEMLNRRPYNQNLTYIEVFDPFFVIDHARKDPFACVSLLAGSSYRLPFEFSTKERGDNNRWYVCAEQRKF